MKLLDIIDGTPIRYGYRIAFLTNFYREPLLRRMELEHGIIRPEWTVLICLSFRDGLNPRDICEITEQPRNTVSRAVTSLTRKGLIVPAADPADARRKVLRITEAGRAAYERIMPMFVEGERKLMACLTERERGDLDRLLDKLCRAVPGWVGG
ncbi:DNA-binding transcriptional regulator, MarR family [Tistlia consotensis]|uniref:DNA-binding transcriptional regulator, MarR family n=1 Tax=Tistlia consotensis USBA 355 TaxID=560819 RepID=A0A1Y6CDY6_9PROT|nr:MarR family winged helix-turn-helix transcriptional regulator [Tistlia consotensis]SMF47704.1 DNA-binding transcriptional regulator, MarR family [Tistlia consotensis USBA 355]SNR82161.1 DNA-binding transcriptional regulator, MarR family [Tistlia consotensis]